MRYPIQVGILGLGRSGWDIHARTLAQMGEQYRITAVCDPVQARLDEAHQKFNCHTYPNLEKFLMDDQVELVVVASPSHLHKDNTIQALQAGKHVLVEKPMALSTAEVDEMIAAAHTAGRVLTVNQNTRYHPDLLLIRGVIDSGVLGQIVEMRLTNASFGRRWDWQTLKTYGGGILNNNGAHLIDWMLQFFDDPDPRVFCHMQTTPLYAGDAESHVKLVVRPSDGPLVDIELTHACAYPQPHCLIMATQGSLVSDRRLVRWKYYLPQDLPPLQLDTEVANRQYNSEEIPWHEETRQVEPDPTWGARGVYEDLYRTLRDGAPLAITPASVRRQIALIEKCRSQNPNFAAQ